MSSAAEELEHAINQTEFNNPICPIYQNYNAKPETNKNSIKKNLLLQLTNPVLWTQSINRIMDHHQLLLYLHRTQEQFDLTYQACLITLHL